MNDHANHQEIDARTLSEGARVRAQADGEIPGGEGDARVAFEDGLREGVARVMGQQTAPESLRASVAAILRDTAVDGDGGGVVRTGMGDTTKRSFWSRSGGWLAVAAVMALAATVLIMSGRHATTTPGGANMLMAQAANFVVHEHDNCGAFSEKFEQKFKAKTESEATRSAIEILHKVPEVMSLPCDGLHDGGYEFAGLGRCAVPGRGASVHLIYENTKVPGLTLSLFVQVDTGDTDLEEGKSYYHRAKAGSVGCVVSAPAPEEGEDARWLVVWREDGYIYYLFAPHSECCQKAREDFHAPEPQVELFDA